MATVEVPGVGPVEVDDLPGGQTALPEEVEVFAPRAYVPERVSESAVDPFSPKRVDPNIPNIDLDPTIFEQVNPDQPHPLSAFGVNPAIEQTPGAPEGPSRLPQIARGAGAPGAPAFQLGKPQTAALLEEREQLRDRQSRLEKQQDERQRVLDMELEAEQRAHDIAIRADEDHIEQIRKSFEAAKQPLPEWDPQPLIDPQEFQPFAFALLALGLVGGIRGGNAWLQAGSAMQGAVRGYIEGNKKKMEWNWQNFQQQYRRAMDINAEERKEYEDALRDKTTSINQKLRDMALIATRLGHEGIRQAAETEHSINSIERQITSINEAVLRADSQYEGFAVRMEQARVRLAQANASQALTPDARQVRNSINEMLGPNNKYTRAMSSRYMGPEQREQFNDLVQQLQEENPGITNRQVANRIIQNAAFSKAADQALDINFKREKGVEHLTNAIHAMENKVKELARSVVPTGAPIANLTINQLQTALGGPQAGPILQLKYEMNEISREVMIAVTMPNSNAQMHAGTAELAYVVFNENMNMDQIEHAILGMEALISTTHAAYDTVTRGLLHDLVTGYPATPEMPEPPLPAFEQKRLDDSFNAPAGVSWKDDQTVPPP